MDFGRKSQEIISVTTAGTEIVRFGVRNLVEQVILRIPVLDSPALGQRLEWQHQVAEKNNRRYVKETEARLSELNELAQMRTAVIESSPELTGEYADFEEAVDANPIRLGHFALSGASQE